MYTGVGKWWLGLLPMAWVWEHVFMRINLIITELRTGGAERCLTELAIGLKALGDTPRVLSLGPLPQGARSELVGRLFDSGITVDTCGARGLIDLPRTVSRARRWLESVPGDITQSFLYHANLITALASGRRSVTPLVAGVRVAQPHRGRSFLESQFSRRFAGVVCVSRSVEQFVRRQWRPGHQTSVTTIRNGIRHDRFLSDQPFGWSQWGLRDTGPVVTFLGRLHRQKGLDLLLDVAPTLLGMYPEVRLAIVGEGPMQGQAERVVRQLPEGRAALVPWQESVGPIYAGSTIVMLPSRYEGMPNVVLEAMAAGRCVLAADVEGVSELLGSVAEPQSFPPGDRGTMMQRLDGLLRRPDLEQLGAANRQRAAQEFSIEAMVQRYREFYQTLVRSGG